MKKETIEIERHKKHIFGYSLVTPLHNDSEEILDKLVKWSNIWLNKNLTIYKHKVRYEQENISSVDFYKFRNPSCPSKDIPYCDLVCYLDIYYQ